MSHRRQTTLGRQSLPWLLLPVLLACAEPGAEDPTGGPATHGELPAGVTLRIRGHQEVAFLPDGSLRPRWFGKQEVGVCLDVPLSIDASQWRVRLTFDGLSEPAAEPLAAAPQAGSVLCFQRPPPASLPPSSDHEVCATVHDGLLDRHYRLPCFRAVYDPETSAFDAAFDDFLELVQGRSGLPREQLLTEVDRLATELTDRGFPILASSLRMVAVHELGLEGRDPAALAERRRRLADRPAWLDQPEAEWSRMEFTIERAALELDAGRPRRAWELFAEADELARSIAAAERVAIVTKQAKILTRMGAGREAVVRLRAVLSDCGRWPCQPWLEALARQLLGWLLVLDPDAGPRDLEEAAEILEADVSGDYEQANRQINHAYLAVRQSRDPAPMLVEARTLLAALEPDAWVRYLSTWADVVDGLAALATGDAERAADRCRAAARSSTRVAAAGWSCLGQVHRRHDRLEAAAAAFDQALVHHELAAPELALDRPLAPGWRVDDYYRAARVAVDLGDPERAWQMLEALDHLSLDVVSACEDESANTRRRLEARHREVRSQLEWTELPLAPQRQRQVEPARHALLRSLEELQWELLSLCRRPLRPAPAAADLRIFALPDEVLSLRRSTDGRVTLARRAALPRREMRQRLDRLAEAQRSGLGDREWRELARPLSAALLPPELDDLGEITRFALHGVLQRVPLEALPVETAGGTRWLGELTTVVLRPAFVEDALPEDDGTGAVPLFVVDPRRNLPSGPAARDAYRRRFPDARILFGAEATAAAVASALPAASFLHVDAHGSYDVAFPELSGLEMADGDLTLADFAGWVSPRRFVNLSGCHTGGAAATGDSGRYGLAGALARGGTRWVIANRSAVEDRLAEDFNDVFYRRVQSGAGVPEAFRDATAELRRDHNAAAWSNLMLLGAGDQISPVPAAGQNRSDGD